MKVRVISAIIAFAILIPLLFVRGVYFAIAMSILSVLMYYEFLKLKYSHNEIPSLIKVFGFMSILYIILGNYPPDNLEYLNYAQLVIPLFLITFPLVFYKKDLYNSHDAFYLLGIIYLIGFLFNITIAIVNMNVKIFIYLLSISIITDTFAYTIGSLIGKHKLCPLISPKKSWEGAIGGLLGGTIVAMIVYCNLLGKFSFKMLIITMLLSIIGQIGDLIFSKIKRENKIKDFSNIMPGHGGISDRLDSLIFILLAYVIITWII